LEQVKIVEVEWIDSVLEHGWTYEQDVQQKATYEAMECKSIGYVLKEDTDFLLLCSGVMPNSSSVYGAVQIPRLAIIKVKELRHDGREVRKTK
jgi:hypothetical protein